MNHTFPAQFGNVLRGSTVLRVIDVLRDVIFPEFASIDANQNDPLIAHEPLRSAAVGLPLDDIEATWIREQKNDERTPTLPQPGGGDLPDVTWAFNQATGARPARWEVVATGKALAEDGTPLDQVQNPNAVQQVWMLDPLTGGRIYSRNLRLPSLNRLPGIIVVPVGLFPILGTIRLFTGQILMGVAPTPNGSALIKIGDGPCISVQAAAARSLDPLWTEKKLLHAHSTDSQPWLTRYTDATAQQFNDLKDAAEVLFDQANQPLPGVTFRGWVPPGPHRIDEVDPDSVARVAIRNQIGPGTAIRVAQLKGDLAATAAELNAAGSAVSVDWLPEAEGPVPPAEERVELAWAKQCLSNEETGAAGARISHLYIEQRDWLGHKVEAAPANPPRALFIDNTSNVAPAQQPKEWGRLARVPIADSFGDVSRPAGYTDDIGGLRPTLNWYSSIGIEMLGCAYSLISNVIIAEFTKGAGIVTRARGSAAGAQLAYYNQVRDVEIRRCSTGISAQFNTTLGTDQRSTVKIETAAGSKEVVKGDWRPRAYNPNSTLFMRCVVEDFGRFGAELHGRTMWAWECVFKASKATKGIGVVLGSGDALVRSCRFDGGSCHILTTPNQNHQQQLKPGEDLNANNPGPIALQPEVPIRMYRGLLRTSTVQTQSLSFNQFTDGGTPVRPRLRLWEFNVRPNKLFNNDPTYWHTTNGRGYPTETEVGQIDRRQVDAWDMSTSQISRPLAIDQPDPTFSPASMWTSTNLLKNSWFHGEAPAAGAPFEPKGWTTTANGPDISITRVMLDEPGYTGAALKIELGPGANGAEPIAITQVVVPATNAAPAADNSATMAAYGRVRGKRLVFGCWVKSSRTGAVQVQAGTLRSQFAWLTDWQQLSVHFEVGDRVHPGMSFVQAETVSVLVDQAPNTTILIGAPTLNLGPDMFPVLNAPLLDEAFGPLTLREGIGDGFRLRLSPSVDRVGMPIVRDSTLTHVMLDVRNEGSPGKALYRALKYDDAGIATPLGDFVVDKNSEIIEVDLNVALKLDDSLVFKRISGPKRTIDVYFQERHSFVV